MKTLPIIGRLALVGCSATTPAASSPDDLSHALAPVFEADMPAALARLQALPEASLDAADRHIRGCVLQRFDQLGQRTVRRNYSQSGASRGGACLVGATICEEKPIAAE